MTNATLIGLWAEYLAMHNQPQTVTTYVADVRKFAATLGSRSLLKATLIDMERWAGGPKEKGSGPRSGASHRRRVMTLKSFYGWAQRHNLCRVHLAEHLGAPTGGAHVPKPVPDDVWLAVWTADLDDALRAALGLGYFCGLRRHEMYALTPQQVTRTTLVDYRRKGGVFDTMKWKTIYDFVVESLPHLVPNPRAFPLALGRLTMSKADLLLPWYNGDGVIPPMAFNKKLDALTRELGVAHVTPHMLRHSAATNLALTHLDDMVIMDLLNHSSLEITAGYTKTSGEYLDRHIDKARRRRA